MSSQNYLNAKLWSVEKVLSWIEGLGECASQYVGLFEQNLVDGCKLLLLTNGDLVDMGINKLHDQEVILRGVGLLQSMTYEISSETLKTHASRVEVACRNLMGLVKLYISSTQNHQDFNFELKSKTEIFIFIEHTLKLTLSMISWINRLESKEYLKWDDAKQTLILCAKVLGSYSRKNMSEAVILSACEQLVEMCMRVIQDFSDPLTSQPATIEIIQLNKEGDQKLGLEIRCSYNGISYISSIEPDSLAARSKKFEVKDEIIQINNQTVLGWDVKILKQIIDLSTNKVLFTLKKKPMLSYMSPVHKKPRSNNEKLKFNRKLQLPSGSLSDEDLLRSNKNNKNNDDDDSSHNEFSVVRSCDDLHMPNSRSSKLIQAEVVGQPSNERTSFSSEGNLLADPPTFYSLPEAEFHDRSSPKKDTLSPYLSPWLPQQQQQQTPYSSPEKEQSTSDSNFDRNYSNSLSRFITRKKKKLCSSVESLLSNDNTSQSPKESKKSKNNKSVKRMSCQDLGGTDCQGWLWMKQEGKGSSRSQNMEKLPTYWIVLKSRTISFYKDQTETLPLKTFSLINCKFSPHMSQSIFSFKVWNEYESFVFAANRKEDMLKWMNKMALASLEDLNADELPPISGFQTFHKKTDSESMDMSSERQLDEDEKLDIADATEGMERWYNEIRRADVTLEGRDNMQRMSAMLVGSTSLKGQKNMNILKLLSLNRMLKDKSQKLEAIQNFLDQSPITPESLKQFQVQNPVCLLNAPGDHG